MNTTPILTPEEFEDAITECAEGFGSDKLLAHDAALRALVPQDEPDWMTPEDAPCDTMMELLVTDRVSYSGKPPQRISYGFKTERGKWREATTFGNYVLQRNLIAVRLPSPPTQQKDTNGA